MSNYRVTAKYEGKDNHLMIRLSLLSFEEDGLFYAYSPALDLTGYGNTEDDAKKSFEIILEEYVKYTDTHHTLIKDLKKLGWSVKLAKNKIKEVKAPSYIEMLEHNSEFNKIVNEKQYRQSFKEVAL